MEQAILHFRQHRKCGDTGLSGEITEQSVELARNGYQMQYVFGAISSDIATLQAVIRG